ncbi:2-aminoethylphosphonate--pyruvate transaminase [Azospirillum sp. ST 5-10]|uniref:2-aminoethylphosphonate--pyruvate transaminase n=1 Tax=unclassified Azospirillum TaxID=2630922 RepID=UPI003F4A33CB
MTGPRRWLLTPGPLTTTDSVKRAMLEDWGSWDGDFRALTAEVRRRLLAIAAAPEDRYACVPMQGSGTFAVEAALLTLAGGGGRVLIGVNGAYGQRMVEICRRAGIAHAALGLDEGEPLTAAAVDRALDDHADVTHLAVVQVETSTGILNEAAAVADLAAARGVRLIVDAMSAFGALPLDPVRHPYEAIVFSTNKCLEGVPGLGFVIVRSDALAAAARHGTAPLSLDLAAQWAYMERTGQFRFTPATHVLAAFRQALDEFDAEGGQPARLARYAANRDALVAAMRRLGLRTLLPDALQSPIIVTFLAPDDPAYRFPAFYEAMKRRGFVIYPGKMTAVESFRLGCIGAVDAEVMRGCAAACAEAMAEMGVALPGA